MKADFLTFNLADISTVNFAGRCLKARIHYFETTNNLARALKMPIIYALCMYVSVKNEGLIEESKIIQPRSVV